MSQPDCQEYCPVCRASTINNGLLLTYHGIDFCFCSEQCLQRFKEHPHLFVGDPKHGLSPKQKGESLLKKHRIVFSEPVDSQLKVKLEQSLNSLVGVIALNFEDKLYLYVTYDLLEVSLEQIEKTIESHSAHLSTSMMDRVKRGLIHYSEECELENLEHASKDG